MPERSLEPRVGILEQKVQDLESLPARVVTAVEVQILQLREEMRSEFSGSRQAMSDVRDELRGEIRAGDEETRRHMRMLHEEVISRIAALGEGARGAKGSEQ